MSTLTKFVLAVLLAAAIVALVVGWLHVFIALSLSNSPLPGLVWMVAPVALVLSFAVVFAPEKYEQDNSSEEVVEDG